MNKLLARSVLVLLVGGPCAGCGQRSDPAGELTQAQIDEVPYEIRK